MSSSDTSAQPPGAGAPLQRRQPGVSLWALASFICAVLLFCPFTAFLAPVLGLIGLAHIRAVPGRRGQSLAVTGIALGLLATLGWIAGAWWWNGNVRVPIAEGPQAAIHAGQVGDVETFRAYFAPDPTADVTDAAAFLDELTRRYGVLTAMSQADHRLSEGALMQEGRVTVPYQLLFSDGAVEAQAQLIILDDNLAGFVLRWAWIIIIDAERGNLAYPPAAADQLLEPVKPALLDPSHA